MSHPYVYEKEPVNAEQLAEEIRQSSITVALDSVSTNGAIEGMGATVTATFKAELSDPEETTLESLVTAHEADFTPPPNVSVHGYIGEGGATLTAPITRDGKLRVLSSHKPLFKDGRGSYNYFAGRGDLVSSGTVGAGQPIMLTAASGVTDTYIDVEFMNCQYPPSEEIWIFGGSVMWQGATFGDHFSLQIRAKASPVVPAVIASGIPLPCDYDLEGTKIKYAGPGMGGYALGGMPVFVPNWNNTGWWDLDEQAMQPVPNMTQTGVFDWHTVDTEVGDYMHELPILGDNFAPNPIDATEAAPVPFGHYLRVCLHSEDGDANPQLAGYLRIYRERLA
jgi:hypothetical protein